MTPTRSSRIWTRPAAAELLCIAPLTATTMARLAHGEAANVLTATALAFPGPVVVAPAMNPAHVDGGRDPAESRDAACSAAWSSSGQSMAIPPRARSASAAWPSPTEIAMAVQNRLEAGSSLAGVRVLVTAGGTREPLDAVRYLGNRSSGRMGAAVADEAARRGADVTLIRSGGAVAPAAPMRVLHAESAAELEQTTLAEAASADIVVMAAAVADYRLVAPADGKAHQGRRAVDGRARTHHRHPGAAGRGSPAWSVGDRVCGRTRPRRGRSGARASSTARAPT